MTEPEPEAGARGPTDGTPSIAVELADRQSILDIPTGSIEELVRHALSMEGREGGVEVALVDDAAIADLHRRFLGVEGPTDVITFPLVEEDDPFLRPGGPQADAPRPLGEIVVSAETALRQAPEQGCDPVRETFLYVVHGVLHLLGYDDRTPETARRMAERQEEILESWMRISGDTI